MAASPTKLEQFVFDIVLGALEKDDTKGYVVSDSGRREILELFDGLTSRTTSHAAAQAMVRCALYVHNQLCCKSAAVDLMNIFAAIGPIPERRRSLVAVDEPRRVVRRKLALVPPLEAENTDTVAWWEVLA